MAKKKDLTILTQDAELARRDRINSLRMSTDFIRDVMSNYVDMEGNASSATNPYMIFFKNLNRKFGIKSVDDLDGDMGGQLLYAYVLSQSLKIMQEGTKNKMLRKDIRNSYYQEAEMIGEIWKRK